MSIASDRLALYLDAEAKILKGQRVKFDSGGITREITRADLREIREGIIFWQKQVNAENSTATGSGRKRPFSCTLADFS